VERADADGGTDYYVFGTVFTSASKPGRTPAGPELLDAAARATTRPVLAIGGITLERLAEVARTHAAGCAAIGLFANEPPERLAGVVAEATRRFRARGPQ
jgi:thiamine monophosphate synthase